MTDATFWLAGAGAAAGGLLSIAGGWSALLARDAYMRLQAAGVSQWGAACLFWSLAILAAHPARSAVLVVLGLGVAVLGAALRHTLADAARAEGLEPILTPEQRS